MLGDEKSANNLIYLYYSKKLSKIKALKLVEGFNSKGAIDIDKTIQALIYLWNDKFDKSISIIEEYLSDNKEADKALMLADFFIMLIEKKKYKEALKTIKTANLHLEEKYKPVYYALMVKMKDQFPQEIYKMGSEYKETVNEIFKSSIKGT
jgi:hypothetical protein